LEREVQFSHGSGQPAPSPQLAVPGNPWWLLGSQLHFSISVLRRGPLPREAPALLIGLFWKTEDPREPRTLQHVGVRAWASSLWEIAIKSKPNMAMLGLRAGLDAGWTTQG